MEGFVRGIGIGLQTFLYYKAELNNNRLLGSFIYYRVELNNNRLLRCARKVCFNWNGHRKRSAASPQKYHCR